MTDVAPGLRLDLEFTAADFQHEWKRCNMVANYAAEYAAYQYPRREMAENLFSTVINELLEALTPVIPGESSLTFNFQELQDELILQIGHCLEPQVIGEFMAYLDKLAKSNGDAYYLSLLTEAGESQHSFNQLGLAMLVHDFKVIIDCRPESGNCFATTVRISTKELQP